MVCIEVDLYHFRHPRTNFPAGKYNANPPTVSVYLQLLCAKRGKDYGFSWCWRVESSRKQLKAHSWLHNAHRCKVLIYQPPFGRNLKRSLGIPNLGPTGARRELGGRELSPPTASQYLSLQGFARFATLWPEFWCQIIAPHPIRTPPPPFAGLGWTL